MPSASLRFEPCVAYGELPRPVDAVLVHDVPDKAGHGDAAVLHLGVAQKADRRLVGLAPELTLAQLERVEVALRKTAAPEDRHRLQAIFTARRVRSTARRSAARMDMTVLLCRY